MSESSPLTFSIQQWYAKQGLRLFFFFFLEGGGGPQSTELQLSRAIEALVAVEGGGIVLGAAIWSTIWVRQC